MSKKKVLLRGVFINRDTNGEGVLKVGTTLIRVSTVMGILYRSTPSLHLDKHEEKEAFALNREIYSWGFGSHSMYGLWSVY